MKTVPVAGLLFALSVGFAFATMQIRSFEVDTSPLSSGDNSVAVLLENSQSGATGEPALANLAFPSTTERPLFNRDRRKFVPPPPPKRVKPARPVQTAKTASRKNTTKPARQVAELELTLIGISISDGVASALLASKNGSNQWVTSGDSIQSWQVSHVDSNSVSLTANGRNVQLQLYKQQEP